MLSGQIEPQHLGFVSPLDVDRRDVVDPCAVTVAQGLAVDVDGAPGYADVGDAPGRQIVPYRSAVIEQGSVEQGVLMRGDVAVPTVGRDEQAQSFPAFVRGEMPLRVTGLDSRAGRSTRGTLVSTGSGTHSIMSLQG